MRSHARSWDKGSGDSALARSDGLVRARAGQNGRHARKLSTARVDKSPIPREITAQENPDDAHRSGADQVAALALLAAHGGSIRLLDPRAHPVPQRPPSPRDGGGGGNDVSQLPRSETPGLGLHSEPGALRAGLPLPARPRVEHAGSGRAGTSPPAGAPPHGSVAPRGARRPRPAGTAVPAHRRALVWKRAPPARVSGGSSQGRRSRTPAAHGAQGERSP